MTEREFGYLNRDSEEARIPSPADYELTWGDLELTIAHCKHWACEVKALMERYFIHEALARAWLAGLKAHRKEVLNG